MRHNATNSATFCGVPVTEPFRWNRSKEETAVGSVMADGEATGRSSFRVKFENFYNKKCFNISGPM
jgi:hypothetical protein